MITIPENSSLNKDKDKTSLPISRNLEDYVRTWTGYKGDCNCAPVLSYDYNFVCPLCDLKQLINNYLVMNRSE